MSDQLTLTLGDTAPRPERQGPRLDRWHSARFTCRIDAGTHGMSWSACYYSREDAERHANERAATHYPGEQPVVTVAALSTMPPAG